MKLFLYNVVDGDNVINKTLTNPLEIDIRLTVDVDVVEPKIILRDIPNVDFNQFNYAFIDDLERYYFVDRIAKTNARDSWVYLTCDVLETYKTDILNSNARVQRNLKMGDYMKGNIDNNITASVSIHESNKSLPDDATESYVVSVMGV